MSLFTCDHSDALAAIRASLNTQAYKISDRVIPQSVIDDVSRNVLQSLMLIPGSENSPREEVCSVCGHARKATEDCTRESCFLNARSTLALADRNERGR